MPANYLKITARRLLRQKAFTLINILGLSIGLATCLLIYLYVYNELTYDAYNIHAPRIARLTSIIHSPESDLALATTPEPLAGALRRDFPEVENTTRIPGRYGRRCADHARLDRPDPKHGKEVFRQSPRRW